jgi:hypothetical protein
MSWILIGILVSSIAIASWQIVDRLERIARALETQRAKTN